jgi:glycosyltransferase involved in cell wall biosynthesis
MVKITIFTPTYNRRHTIDRLYKSLTNQTSKEFEWVIVDDGSIDDTKEYIDEILKTENSFSIRYIKVTNGGKHRAINLGLDLAKGEYFFIVDSDDYLTADSIEIISKWLDTIPENNEKISGVCGLKGYSENDMVGETFNGEYLDCTALQRYENNIFGDKSEVIKTDVLRKYRFPEINGEKFITEAIVWNRIAKDGYSLRYFNEINYLCNYLEDGLTMNIDKLYCNNFEGYSMFVKELLTYETSLRFKIRTIIAYGYRGRLKRVSFKEMASKIKFNRFLLIMLANIGGIYKRITKK